VLALTWASVDLDAGTIAVEGQLGRDSAVHRTKTKRSREISISDTAVDVLREHRRRMRSSELLGTGRPYSRRNVLRAWQSALAGIGIDGCGLHTLRHSFVSRLEERGVSVAIAAELVGHSRVTTTQAVYTRMRGGREARLAAQREALRIASA
jgi:integrase